MSSAEIESLIEDFELLGDWDARYHYLVELGEAMPPMAAQDKTPDNRVVECMSLVHVAARPEPTAGDVIHYSGDCDTAIIKGVVAILVRLFSGKTRAEIEALDVDSLFQGLHLHEHLSPNRHVGVYAIVNKMKQQAG